METVNFLLDRPVALLIVLLVGALIGVAFERAVASADAAKRKAYWQGRNAQRFGKKGAGLRKIEAAMPALEPGADPLSLLPPPVAES